MGLSSGVSLKNAGRVWLLALTATAGVLTLAPGCGSSESGSQERSHSEAQQLRQARRHLHRAQARARRAAARRQAHRAEIVAARRKRAKESREVAAREAETTAEEAQGEEAGSDCDPNYSGACLDPYASDYDCEGGSGDGPLYTGPVTVVGEDHYGLDANSNQIGCEPE
jgi:acyl-CoA reductase-like NAD-dependent aldehyde dehydrogenase